MTILRGIPHPFAGEHVLTTVPPLGPYAQAAADEPALRKRLHFFAQRSLTHTALLDEQRGRIAAALSLGQAVAPGVVHGLELGLEGETLVLLPGQAMGPQGHDVELAYPLRVRFDALPVVSPRVEQGLQGLHSGPTPWAQLPLLQRQATLARVLAELGGARFLPHAMVLVAMPRTVAIDRTGALNSPCPNALDESAFDRTAWEDGFQLAWVPWPDDRSPPLWSQNGRDVDAHFRNRLAYAVFNAERERLSASVPRSMRQWLEEGRMTPQERERHNAQAARAAEQARAWPWESLGVALSIVAFDGDFRPVFADRAAVVRQGGGRHNRSVLVPASGDDVLWQARVSQLLEHLAELPPEQRNATTLQEQFDWLPPAGVLPVDVADFIHGRQHIFPPQFDVSAQPVPLDMVDALIAEASPLRPFNLSLRDQVQLLVPVPARYYEPDLLKLDERIHPLFDLEISRLSVDRQRLLARRDALRRRSDLLMQAVTGSLPAYPQDDPSALPDETGANDALAFARVHRSSVPAGGADLHQFSGSHVRLHFEAADELIFFVRYSGSPLGLGIHPLIRSVAGSTPPATRPFVWGSAPATANADRVGDLPAADEWVRLSVPMARAGLAGQSIDGLAFAVFGGAQPCEVTWGYAGKAASGYESYWLSDALPPGALAGGTWTWLIQGEAFADSEDRALGLPLQAPGVVAGAEARPHTRQVAELDKLLASWRAYKGGVLTVELGEPINTARTASTTPRTMDAGLDELITRLDLRIRTAGDHVDFGFLRARTEIFRMRQSVLGVDNAGRFLTSPAAAELVQRSDNPVASEKEFADYFKRLNEVPPAPPPFSPRSGTSVSPPPAPAPSPASVRPVLDFSTLNSSLLSGRTTGTNTNTSTSTLSRLSLRSDLLGSMNATTPLVRTNLNEGVIGGDLLARGVELDTGSLATPATRFSGGTLKEGLAARSATLAFEPPPAVRDVVSASLLGATFNTVTVAERFTAPASVMSSNAAAKGKGDFVGSGLSGLRTHGVVVDDLPVYGYRRGNVDEGDDPTRVTAADLLRTETEVSDDDAQTLGTDQHEAVYFRRSIEAIDNTIRFLRGVELRAEDYRRLQADARNTRSSLLTVVGRLQSAIDALAHRLAEVRHDLSVARALRAEEQARVDALIARRKAILAEQVPFLVFRRPRLGEVLHDLPRLATQPAAFDDPVPRCRSEAHDAPPELMAMVDTMRDVPVRWWRRLSQDMVKLDRLSDLQQLAEASMQRMARADEAASLRKIRQTGHDSVAAQLMTRSLERQHERLDKARRQAAPQMQAMARAATWKQAAEPLLGLASIRDLLEIGPASREVTLAAAGLLDDVAGVGACLHAAFCTVPAASRLRWVQLFSQLDEASSLRRLSVLPGFGDERLGVSHTDWRQMQAMVDWLFAQVADDEEAQAAINDLVRVCLLLASHASIRRILSARIRQPRPAVVNTTLDIELDPALARVGMQVLVHGAASAGAATTVLARAVVEDLGAAGAVARITQVMTVQPMMLTASMQVQLQTGPALSTPKAQQADRAVVQALAQPFASAGKAGATTAAPAPAAAAMATAEKRVAQQVEALRAGGARARVGLR